MAKEQRDEEIQDDLEDEQDDQDEQDEESSEKPTEPAPKKPYSDEAIPEALRGMAPDQISKTWDLMLRTVDEQGKQLTELRKSPAQAARAAADDEVSESLSKEQLQDLMIEDPEKAVTYITRKAFGQDFQHTSSNAETSVFLDARERLLDFRSYEEKVRKLLRDNSVQITPENVRGAYLMIAGEEALETKSRKGSPNTSERPTPRAKGSKKDQQFENEAHREIWKRSGLTKTEYFNLMDLDVVEVEVPTGGK